ncbi:MAG: hypothetical protein ACRDD2_06175 [Sarcina sp.]
MKDLLKDSSDYEDYDKNVVVLSEEDLIELNLMEKYMNLSGGCSKGKSGCCSKSSSIEIVKSK